MNSTEGDQRRQGEQRKKRGVKKMQERKGKIVITAAMKIKLLQRQRSKKV